MTIMCLEVDQSEIIFAAKTCLADKSKFQQ